VNTTVTIHVPMRFAIRGGQKRIVSEIPDPKASPRTENALLKALAKAHRWRRQIENGEYASITELARAQRINESYACRLLRLTLLAPKMVDEIVSGKSNLPIGRLIEPFPAEWDAQITTLNVGPIRAI